jgi:hypothetical protein
MPIAILDSDGYVWDGFDYALQVWVIRGVVVPCAHPLRMRRVDGSAFERDCCSSHTYAGLQVRDIPGAETR